MAAGHSQVANDPELLETGDDSAKEMSEKVKEIMADVAHVETLGVDSSQEGNRNECPCKRLPPSRMSSFSAAECGDVHSLARLGSGAAKRVGPGGITPLHLAAQNGHVAATQWLLFHGAASVVHDATSSTPLHRASFSGAVSTMRLLLQHPAGNKKSIENWEDKTFGNYLLARDESFGDFMTPLHKAAAGGRYLAVGLLLDAIRQHSGLLGSCLTALDSVDRSPLQVAQYYQNRQEEERKCVQRWNVVAGGVADWDRCVQLLQSASKETLSSSTIFDQVSPLPNNEAVMDNEEVSCLDCESSDSGQCKTASWETAFSSALFASVEKIIQQESSHEGSNNKSPSTVMKQEDTQPLGGANQTSINEAKSDQKQNLGQQCFTCGINTIVLFRGTNGTLVCRRCQKRTRPKAPTLKIS